MKDLLHLLLLLGSTVGVAAAPVWLLRQGVYLIPLLCAVMWAVAERCILNPVTESGTEESFIAPYVRAIFPSATDLQVCYATYAVFIAVPTVLVYRLLRMLPPSPSSSSTASTRRR